jgi:hypothetical protein
MTKLLDLMIQLDLHVARQAADRTADLNYGKWFGKFSAAMNRYLGDEEDGQRAKVVVAWNNLPPGLQQDIAAAARFAGCDDDMAQVVGDLPALETVAKTIGREPMW